MGDNRDLVPWQRVQSCTGYSLKTLKKYGLTLAEGCSDPLYDLNQAKQIRYKIDVIRNKRAHWGECTTLSGHKYMAEQWCAS